MEQTLETLIDKPTVPTCGLELWEVGTGRLAPGHVGWSNLEYPAVPLGMELRAISINEQRQVHSRNHQTLAATHLKNHIIPMPSTHHPSVAPRYLVEGENFRPETCAIVLGVAGGTGGVGVARTKEDGECMQRLRALLVGQTSGAQTPSGTKRVLQMRRIILSIQDQMNPKTDLVPDPENPKLRWAQVADDPVLANEHFRRAFCYVQKHPADGVVQELVLSIHNKILHVYLLSIYLAQWARVAILWDTFQAAYTASIEAKVFITEAERQEAIRQERLKAHEMAGGATLVLNQVGNLVGEGGKGVMHMGGFLADAVSSAPIVGSTAGTAINAVGDGAYMLGDATKAVGKATTNLGLNAVKGGTKKTYSGFKYAMKGVEKIHSIRTSSSQIAPLPHTSSMLSDMHNEFHSVAVVPSAGESHRWTDFGRYLQHREVDAETWSQFETMSAQLLHAVVHVIPVKNTGNDMRQAIGNAGAALGQAGAALGNAGIQLATGNVSAFGNAMLVNELLGETPPRPNIRPIFSSLVDDTTGGEESSNQALKFVDLVLYNHPGLRANAVAALNQIFTRREKLRDMLTKAPIILSCKDKTTLKFVRQRKMRLRRALDLMVNPDKDDVNDGIVSWADRAHRLHIVHEILTTLNNDPGLHGGCIGLTNLCWMDIDRAGAGVGASRSESTDTTVNDAFVYVPVREDLVEGNQFILGEEGVHDIVIEFLEKNESTAREDFEVDVFGPEIRGVYRELFKFIFFFVCDAPANRVLLANERIMRVLHGYLEWWPGSDVVCLLREILVDDERGSDLIMERHVKLYCRKLLGQVKRLSGQLIKEQEAARDAGAAAVENAIPSMPSFEEPRSAATNGTRSPPPSLGSDGGSVASSSVNNASPKQLNKTRHEPLYFEDVVAAVDFTEWYGSRVNWSQATELVLLLLEILECNHRPVERLQRVVFAELEEDLQIKNGSDTMQEDLQSETMVSTLARGGPTYSHCRNSAALIGDSTSFSHDTVTLQLGSRAKHPLCRWPCFFSSAMTAKTRHIQSNA